MHRRKKKFGQVPLDYGTPVSVSEENRPTQVGEDIAFTALGHLIPSSADFEEERKKWKRKNRKEKPAKGPKMELEKEKEVKDMSKEKDKRRSIMARKEREDEFV